MKYTLVTILVIKPLYWLQSIIDPTAQNLYTADKAKYPGLTTLMYTIIKWSL